MRGNHLGMALSAVLIFALAGCGDGGAGTDSTPGGTETAQEDLVPFTFVLDFIPDGLHAGYYAALEHGWYAEEGLDVEIVRGNGSGDTVQRIAAGQGDAGLADFSAIVASIANDDAPVVAIASHLRRPPHGVFVLEDSGIDSPSDLEGAEIGTTPGNANQILFPLFAQEAGFDGDSVDFISMEAAALGPALITEQVDGSLFFAGHFPRVSAQAAEADKSITAFRYADYGLEMYSNSIFASRDALENNRDNLAAFVRASLRGLQWTYESEANTREAAEIVLSHNPEATIESLVGSAEIYGEYALTEEISSGDVQWGEFEEDRVALSRDVYTEFLELEREVPTEDLYTNELIAPGAP